MKENYMPDNNNKYLIIRDRGLIGNELISADRSFAKLIPILSNCGYFTANCVRHDDELGGMPSHALWALRFGKMRRDELIAKNQAVVPSERSVVLCCLLHDICDSNYPSVPGANGIHGGRSAAILEKIAKEKNITISNEEITAVKRHMHPNIESRPNSRIDSNDVGEVLHYIIHEADGAAIEYAGNIPYGTPPMDITDNYAAHIRKMINIPCDECVMYVSRYPDFHQATKRISRASYAMLKKKDSGKWIPVRIWDDQGIPKATTVNDGEYDSYVEARESMRHVDDNRYKIQVTDGHFFTEIKCL